MADYITEGELSSYLQVKHVAGKNTLTVELANGAVTDVIGDVLNTPAMSSRIKAITLEAAARHARNPLAFSSEQVKTDDYDTTERREGKALTAPGVYLTDGEKDELREHAFGLRGGRTGTIRLRVPRA